MKSTPARRACPPRCCETVLAICSIRFNRPCGLEGNVPNDATPAMLTAGPTGSVGSASRLLLVNCARVSFTVRAPRVIVLL